MVVLVVAFELVAFDWHYYLSSEVAVVAVAVAESSVVLAQFAESRRHEYTCVWDG